MTAYELASLHAQLGQTINAQLANWLAILSIYLGAGYLFAHRMALWSAIAATFMAALTLTSFALTISRTLSSLVGVSAEIQKLAHNGGGLEWHEATRMTAFWIAWFPTNSLILMTAFVVISVYFFFSTRHQALKSAPPQTT